MLTKSDLLGIQKIVDGSVQKQTRKIVQEELAPIKTNVQALQTDMHGVKKDIKGIKSELKKVRKTVDVMGRLLDGEQMRQRKRIVRIEEHLGFAQI